MTDYWPQSSAKELLELYTSTPSWHAQEKCDLYKTGFVNRSFQQVIVHMLRTINVVISLQRSLIEAIPMCLGTNK